MLRKLFITALLLVAFLPVNSWAISKIKYDIYSPGNGYSQVHGSTSVKKLYGTLYGNWDDSAGVFSGITGWLKGNYGRVDFTGGHLNFNGSGSLYGSVHKYGYYGVAAYTGKFSFKDAGWYGGRYNNVVTEDYLKIWGGGKFWKSFTPYNSDWVYNSKYKKWLGIDLYGHGEKVEVPEPATMGLMGLGLVGMAALRRKKTTLA